MTADMSSSSTTDTERGVAKIKAEFICYEHKRTVSKYLPQYLSEQIKESSAIDKTSTNNDTKSSDVHEPERKKAKLKGRFTKRPREKKIEFSDKVCPALVREEECRFGDKCRFSHDVAQFLKDSPPLSGECYVFNTYGKCRYGVTCLHASQHITVDFKNISKQDLVDKWAQLPPRVTNTLERDLSRSLSRRQYDFDKSAVALKEVKQCKANSASATSESDVISHKTVENAVVAASENTPASDAVVSCDSVQSDQQSNQVMTAAKLSDDAMNGTNLSDDVPKAANHLDNVLKSSNNSTEANLDVEGIRIRPEETKKIDFRDKLYLAPLTTVGNLPFRRICKEFGADITCSEMATCTGLLQGSMSEWALIKRHHTEDLFGAQICGSYADRMTRCAQLLTEQTDVDFIDVNMGCPIELFYQNGEGCALMHKPGKVEVILSSMRAVMRSTPLTVKMRTGISEDKPTAHKLIARLSNIGVSLVTLHGRSREQRYTRFADWQYINQCSDAAQQLPVFGNGDVLSYRDYSERRESTGVAGCMIARGALIKPWIFTEIKERRDWDISSSERLDMLRSFTNYGLEHWGSDKQGVANTRKFLLEWLSFLHRYIPVGLLERPPQRINEKPPHYVGRNDLETMMASRNSEDWVKISEMLLGPVPDGFQFVPKHKANAYS